MDAAESRTTQSLTLIRYSLPAKTEAATARGSTNAERHPYKTTLPLHVVDAGSVVVVVLFRCPAVYTSTIQLHTATSVVVS